MTSAGQSRVFSHSKPPAELPGGAHGGAEVQDSLVRRLTRLNLQVLALTMLLSFGLIAAVLWLGARERQAHAAELAVQQLANSLAPMLVFEDRAAASAELQAFARRSDVLEVLALAADQSLFVSWTRPDAASQAGTAELPRIPPAVANRQVGAGESPLALRSSRMDRLEVWVPVRFKGEWVGALLLRESLQNLQLMVLRIIGAAALLIALAIAVAWRVLRLVQGRALAPIVELSLLAEQVSTDQDFSRRARVHRPDEVGRLSERFNQMLKRVEISQQELNQRLRQEQAAGQQFEQLAHQDSLTQLPNRLFFQSALQRHVAASCREASLMALMFIDLDSFKAVNDQHGHDAGDAVLREVAQRMSRVLRSHDVLCRLGGDEFGLILPELPGEAAAEQLALRLIAAVREPLHVGGQLMPIGATVGLAFCPGDESEAAQLLVAADVAMYAAKRAGKNTYRRAGHAATP